jgi:hypothetical protein
LITDFLSQDKCLAAFTDLDHNAFPGNTSLPHSLHLALKVSQAKLSTMKYYRFSRRRKDYLGLSDYFRSKKKSDYMINTGQVKNIKRHFP